MSIDQAKLNTFLQQDWIQSEASMFNIDIFYDEQEIVRKINQCYPRLIKFCDFCVGVQAYDSYVGQKKSIIENRIYHAENKKDETFIPELNGKDVSRYHYEWNGKQWISYGKWLAHPRKPHFFTGDRILVREITSAGRYAIHATFVDKDYVNYKTILNIILTEETKDIGYSLFYFLGIINSALLSWYFPRVSNKLITKTFPRISILDLKRFPIREINFANSNDKMLHDKIVDLVVLLIGYIKNLNQKKLIQEKNILKNQIDIVNTQIDRLVYQLYCLTDEEINIIESEVR